MEDPTDEALMEQFQRGHAPAFDALFSRHARGVRTFLGRMVRDPALADDLTQTTFLSVVRARDRYAPGQRFTGWLFRIASNAARDALSHRRRWQGEAPALDGLEAATVAPSDPALAKRLEAALAELPVEQREAVILHHLLEWTYDEMAEALGTHASTMRVRAHRGYTRLRVQLADLAEWT
jgi:RNA polymerase sigma-70 factor (ECF subfamily)